MLKESPAPFADAHARCKRPRPAVCSSATIARPSAAPSDAMRASSVLVEGNESNRKSFGLRSVIDGRTRLYRNPHACPHLDRNSAGAAEPVRRRGIPDEDVLHVARLQHDLCRRVPRLVLFLRECAFQPAHSVHTFGTRLPRVASGCTRKFLSHVRAEIWTTPV